MTDYRLMPVAPTQDMLSRVMSIVTGFSGPYGEFNDYLDEETAREVYAAFLADAPDVSVEPIRRAIVALERYTYDPLAGRNSARELRELLDVPPAMQEKPAEQQPVWIGWDMAGQYEWIPTNGKKPELPDDTLVDVKFLNGHIEDGSSVNTWKWTQYGESYDITHYRIHQPVSAVQLEPDVSALVEALECISKKSHDALKMTDNRAGRAKDEIMCGYAEHIIQMCDAALSAHRKGGE